MAARPDEIKTDITLEIDAPVVKPSEFLKAVRAFFGMLGAVTEELAEPKSRFKWAVRVQEGSAIVGVVPIAGVDVDYGLVEAVKGTIKEGLRVLEQGPVRPKNFPEVAVRHLHELAEVTDVTDSGRTQVRVWVKHDPTPIGARVVANTNEILGWASEDFGTVEGRLRVVSERGNLQFAVTEPVWSREIRCYINEDLLPRALMAFRKRVEVSGTIRYRKDGTPVSVEVTDLVEFPPEDKLPDYTEVRGILRPSP